MSGERPQLTITHHSLRSGMHGGGNQATLVPRTAWAVPGLRATVGSCTGHTLLTAAPLRVGARSCSPGRSRGEWASASGCLAYCQ